MVSLLLNPFTLQNIDCENHLATPCRFLCVHQTGCNANLFYADAPKPRVEVMTEAFWDYVAKATQTADDTIQMIKKTQFGQDVRYLSL